MAEMSLMNTILMSVFSSRKIKGSGQRITFPIQSTHFSHVSQLLIFRAFIHSRPVRADPIFMP